MRIVNRLLAALLALALIVGAVLLIIEVIATTLGHQQALVHWHQSYAWAHRTPWQQGSVRVAAATLLVLGFLLLIAELKRPRVSRLPVAAQDAGDQDDVAFTRRGVAAALRAAVTDVDGIMAATVRVKRRSVSVQAQAAAQDGRRGTGPEGTGHRRRRRPAGRLAAGLTTAPVRAGREKEPLTCTPIAPTAPC